MLPPVLRTGFQIKIVLLSLIGKPAFTGGTHGLCLCFATVEIIHLHLYGFPSPGYLSVCVKIIMISTIRKPLVDRKVCLLRFFCTEKYLKSEKHKEILWCIKKYITELRETTLYCFLSRLYFYIAYIAYWLYFYIAYWYNYMSSQDFFRAYVITCCIIL